VDKQTEISPPQIALETERLSSRPPSPVNCVPALLDRNVRPLASGSGARYRDQNKLFFIRPFSENERCYAEYAAVGSFWGTGNTTTPADLAAAWMLRCVWDEGGRSITPMSCLFSARLRGMAFIVRPRF